VIPLVGGSQSLRMWHIIGMWLFIAFAVIHIYMAIRADVMSRQSSISAIVSGWRLYRD
jgi:Ni/Fe-hydrogenase 1 B-type cytochrome subunit